MTAVAEQVALQRVAPMAFLVVELQATILEETQTPQISDSYR